MKLFLSVTVFVGLVSTEMAVATTDFLRAHRELAAAACEGCATGSSGPCKASTTVCYKTLADGTCPPNTAFCFPNTADPDVCKNTADYGGLDQGCTTAKPICTSIAKKYIGNDVNGKNCVKCVNVYNDPPNTAGGPRPDFGCPASAPNCVYADGSDVKPFWYAGDTCTSACPLNKLDYTSGFDCPSSASPFKFNGNAKCVGTGTGILRFTEDIDYQVGTAFRPFTFASCNNELTFTWEVDYSITGAGNGDADGLALVMHQDSRGTSAIGGAGGAMGVYEPNSIKKALVIELDTYPNPDLLDAFSDSIHVTTLNGAGAITELADVSFNVRSGTKVKVVYDGTTLKVYMNGSGSPSATAAVDLNSIFTGKSVFVGFAAATGAEGDVHEVSKFTLLG